MRKLIFTSIIFCCLSYLAAADESEKRWIMIYFKTMDNQDSFNYGWIRSSDYSKMVQLGKYPDILQIHDMYWFTNDGPVFVEDDEKTGVVIIRTDRIVRILEVKPPDMNKLKAEEAERIERLKNSQKKDKSQISIP